MWILYEASAHLSLETVENRLSAWPLSLKSSYVGFFSPGLSLKEGEHGWEGTLYALSPMLSFLIGRVNPMLS